MTAAPRTYQVPCERCPDPVVIGQRFDVARRGGLNVFTHKACTIVALARLENRLGRKVTT